ncbi:MAG: CPBP family intramembrane metalloprotease [Phycisphaerales bacterium]|nr:MAG: CPBP family intramembrane metalloprotease [Phycisphaerales bacterium]
MAENTNIRKHSLVRSSTLHLLPGLLVVLFYITGAKWSKSLGLPTLFFLYLAIALVMIPFELGYMLCLGKKQTGRLTLSGIVLYRQAMPWWQYCALILPMLVWAFVLLSFIAQPIDRFVFRSFFQWLPSWFRLDPGDADTYSKTVLLLLWGFYFITNISGAIVEELYFRGFLLPRISHLGFWAPLVNTVLFSAYHFFTPSENISRILALLPMVYVVWWRRNIYIGMLLHCGGNAAGLLIMLAQFVN